MDSDCNHEVKTCLRLGRKAMTNLDSMLKSRDITLPTKVYRYDRSYGFSSSLVWMWELVHEKGWVPKNWCFSTVVLEKTLESPLDCKEIKQVNHKRNQSWLFIGRTWCWSWSSNTLATWCEELTHWKRPWCWKRLKAGGEGDDRGWDGYRGWHHRLDGHGFEPTRRQWRTGKPGMLQSMGSQRVRHDWATEDINTELTETERGWWWPEVG